MVRRPSAVLSVAVRSAAVCCCPSCMYLRFCARTGQLELHKTDRLRVYAIVRHISIYPWLCPCVCVRVWQAQGTTIYCHTLPALVLEELYQKQDQEYTSTHSRPAVAVRLAAPHRTPRV